MDWKAQSIQTGQLYKFNGTMPNFGETYTDDEVAGVIDYLHNAFVALGPKPSSGFKSVKPAEIKALRNKRSGILDVNKRARDRMKILA